VNLGGLGARAALKQNSTKLCNRCGLRYSVNELECTHCKGMSDSELSVFKEHIEASHESNAKFGSIFFVIALALGVWLLLFF
jgi:hypothetical protein